MNPALFALLVGIDKYLPPVKPLNGCKNDVLKLEQYLKTFERKHFHFPQKNVKKIINADATKENIVNVFLDHFNQAIEGDIALFYFSGHGTQELADPTVWSNEIDKKLECLVCYDSIVEGDNYYNFLADKEIRWLIHTLASKGVQVVTIFDCCHSGDITRNSWIQDSNESYTKKELNLKGKPAPFPSRAITDFIFYENNLKRLLQTEKISLGQSLENYLPQGNHIRITACRSDESAFIHNSLSVFTKVFVELLERVGGMISYFDLRNITTHYIKNRFNQTPQVYVKGPTNMLFQNFLNKEINRKPLYGNILCPDMGTGDQDWEIDIGSIHGMSKRETQILIQNNNGKVIGKAQPKRIEANRTSLEVTEGNLNKELNYVGFCNGFLSSPVSIFIVNKNKSNPETLEKELKNVITEIGNLHLVVDITKATYVLFLNTKSITIHWPGKEYLKKPLVQAVGFTKKNFKSLKSYLIQIAQWEYIKNLHNPSVFAFKDFPVTINCYETSSDFGDSSLISENDIFNLPYKSVPYYNNGKNQGHKNGFRMKIKLINNWQRKLYVSIIYLGMDFASTAKLLNPPVIELIPGQEHYCAEDWFPQREIPIYEADYLKAYGFKQEEIYFKIIASTNKDTLDKVIPLFELIKLPHPGQRGDIEDATTEEENMIVNDWITRTLSFNFLI